MTEEKRLKALRFAAIAAATIVCASLPGLSQQSTSQQSTSQQSASASALPTSNASPAEQPKGKSFAKPADAAAALYAAARRDDDNELLVILGPNAKGLVHWNDDAAMRKEERTAFADKYDQMHRLVKEPDNTVALYVGAENWPVPVPLVRYHGAWYFDADLGMQEVRYRRIGRNEMEALEVCHTLVDAEKEYQAIAHQYTAKFVSGSGHDGLYWKSSDDSTRSPIGPYLAHAGISESGAASTPFHGYYYRIVLHGSDKFSIVAFPAEYSSSGVMTFVINLDGSAYEKDFGDQTATVSKPPASSDSDSSWKKVE
jgi:Protein of unknown function (DUF2950)